MKTNTSAFLQGYMHKEAGLGSVAKGLGSGVKGLGGAIKRNPRKVIAGGAAYGGKKAKDVYEGTENLINKSNDKRKEKHDEASGIVKEKPKPTPAVRSNRKG